jgi:murein DD-endopeptidase MepM/ murein hydrolase activator NlpD
MRKKSITVFLAGLILLAWAIPSTPAGAQNQPAGPVYIVQEGDTLWSIALRFNVSVSDLETTNNLSDSNIFAGEELVIPGLPDLSGTLTSQPVRYGDTLRSLARQYRLAASLLSKLNHVISPDELYAGDSLALLQQANQPSWSGRAGLGKGGTLLELAVGENTDPWTLVGINQLSGTWDGLPGDALDLPSGSSTSPASGLPAVFASVSVDPLPIQQGSTVQVKVVTQQPVTLSGSLVSHALHFYADGTGAYVALQGVDAMADPGLYSLDLQAGLPDGSVQAFAQRVPVDSGNYLHDTTIYYVDPKTIDPQFTGPDAAKVQAFTSVSTQDKYWQGAFSSPASLYAALTYVSSPFGIRRSYLGTGTDLKLETYHSGMDYAGGLGQPITAPAAGIVVFAGPLVVCGNATYLYHGWGVYSGICHQSAIKVTVGQLVGQGDLIGLVGNTGRILGPNLHWEVWVNGVTVNPLQWLGQAYPH